ncbi:hypothetical protein B0T17DRAFT_620856 [Bombardia bombarda]|uniref:Berberine/berberine-like domain-containing protein n=1 Tax=Bombardia bombarda TaxID=252184 RepID=A0AA39TKB1_9PEZI|nr:hypothetical protein B0T17DRAFT_620856 [Bombardia bombarda]
MKAFRRLFAGEKVEFLVTWIHTGGRATEPKASSTAYYWREAIYHAYVTVEWEDKWMERDMRGFMGEVKKKLRPLSLNGEAAFINFPDGVMAKRYEQAYFGNNSEELRRIKKIWDKDNFFKWDQGVRLPGTGSDKEPWDGNEPNDEDLTDSLAGEQWNFYETKDIVKDLQGLDDLGY